MPLRGLSSSRIESVTAQHLFLPLRASLMSIPETPDAGLNLIVSKYASVSHPSPSICSKPSDVNNEPITAVNYTATFRMCLDWPLQDKVSDSKMAPIFNE